ncbi:sulfur carrier protein ThiS [Algivirga pacifica]|uniref:Sulfur carrier protein ThiS n=1 Tax=Algivirga pacifica TaxID=1162670 RepID=A0ABP9DPT1_9BACT
MQVLINQRPIDCQEKSTLLNLIEEQQFSQQGIAVAVNNNIVPKINWASHVLNANDHITIIGATQGG